MKTVLKNKGLVVFYLIIFISALILVNDVKNEKLENENKNTVAYQYQK